MVTPQTRFKATSSGQKDAGRRDQQHHHRRNPYPAVRVGHNLHVLGDKLLPGGQEVADHVRDRTLHGGGMKDQARNGEHHDDEGKQ